MFNYEIALNYWEFFLLILVRIASFVYTAPFFNISSVPQKVKISISIFISILIFMITPDRTIEYTGLLDYAILIIKESVVGLLLGFVCNVCIQAITFAGHIIDTDIWPICMIRHCAHRRVSRELSTIIRCFSL